jgi:hypothetical protein
LDPLPSSLPDRLWYTNTPSRSSPSSTSAPPRVWSSRHPPWL